MAKNAVDTVVGRACTGCTACENCCPRDAIEMLPDHEGFQYPYVHQELCISCGLCVEKCHIANPVKDTNDLPIVYAGWNKSYHIRVSSTSGGVFTALAEAFIKKNGFVVGAYYDDQFVIRHTIAGNMDEIEKLRQSKYAQSDMMDVFSRIKHLLHDGKMVLFCGTPCQSGGLQRYLGDKYENLYCCDFICRGVASPKVYRKYLDGLFENSKTAIQKIQFKNKDYGWNRFSTKITFKNGSVFQQDRNHDPYMKGYLRFNLYLRPCCYECQYKQLPRISDISLGDFWGIGKLKAELDDDRGTSAILVNSAKGAQMLDWIRDQLYLEERSFEEVLAGNVSLVQSPERGEFREYFFEHMDRMRFDKLIMKIEEKSWHLTPKETVLRELHLLKVKLKDWIK